VSLAGSSWINLDDPPPAEGLPPVVIEARHAGIQPDELVKTVTAPLEKALTGIEGVRRLCSLTLEGRCLVRLDLVPSADEKKVREAAAKRLADAKSNLPETVRGEAKLFPEVSPSFFVVALYATDSKARNELSALGRNTIRPKLERLANVADVRTLGDAQERIYVMCDPTRLAVRGVSMSDVLAALKKQSDRPPKNAVDLEEVVISEINGQAVLVRDLAVVQEGRQWHGRAGLASRVEQRHSADHSPVLFLIQNKPGDLQDFAKNLDLAIQEMKNAIPLGVRLDRQVFQVNDPMIILGLPSGVPLERKAQLARTVAEAASKLSELQGIYWFTALDDDEILMLPFMPANLSALLAKAKLTTQLRSALNKGDLLKGAANRIVHVLPTRSLESPLISWPGQGSHIVIRISGEPLRAREAADQLRLQLSRIEGVIDLHTNGAEKPHVNFLIDERKCKDFGIKPSEVRQIIRIHQEGIEVEGLKIAGRSAFLALPLERIDVESIRQLAIPNGMGQRVPLASIAAVQLTLVPGSIYRESGKNCLIVSGNIQGRSLAEVRQEIRKLTKELSLKDAQIELE
jgi:multidrug efflux pump subunit AcrB